MIPKGGLIKIAEMDAGSMLLGGGVAAGGLGYAAHRAGVPGYLAKRAAKGAVKKGFAKWGGRALKLGAVALGGAALGKFGIKGSTGAIKNFSSNSYGKAGDWLKNMAKAK